MDSEKVRAEFEKKWPVPLGARWDEACQSYECGGFNPNAIADSYNSRFVGYKSRQKEVALLEKQLEEVKVQCNSYGKRLVVLGEDNIVFYTSSKFSFEFMDKEGKDNGV